MGLRDFLFESDRTPQRKPEPEKASPVQDQTLSERSPLADPGQGENDFYNRLVAKTDFYATNAGRAVKKYLDALAVIPDETLRLKTAIAQAKTLEGVTNEQLAEAFISLQEASRGEEKAFQEAMEQYNSTEVKGRGKYIEELKDILAKTQENLLTETSKLNAANQSVANNLAWFQSAITRRTDELNKLAERISSLSKG